MSRSLSVRSPRSPLGGGGSAVGERGFTLAEAAVVLAVIGVILAFAIPNLVRARVRSITLSQMKQVRQAVMLTRVDAIRGGRQAVLGFTTVIGRPALISWRDDNGDRAHQAGEATIGRWTFAERVTVESDPAVPLRILTGTARGVVFLANGTVLSHPSGGPTGSGAFRVTDVKGNRFQISVQGGSGTVTEEMWDPDGSTWSDRFVHWRY